MSLKLREKLLNLILPFLHLGYFFLLVKHILFDFSLNHYWPLWLILAVIGLLVWLTSYLYLSPSWYFYPQTNQLVTKGTYRFIRHPVYLGSIVVFLSISLLVNSQPALWYVLFLILPVNFARSKWEEKILTDIFGQKYKTYLKKTWF